MRLASTLVLVATAASADDAFLRDYAETRRFMAGRPAAAKITPDSKAVLFLRSKAKRPEQSLLVMDVASGQVKELITPEQILQGAQEKLSAEEKARLERLRISARGITSYKLSKDGRKVLVGLSGRLFVVERESGKVQPLEQGDAPMLDPSFSPDGKQIAFVRDYDLHVVELASGRERRVTKGGSKTVMHGLPEFVAQEEMGRFQGYWWSPDSKLIAYQQSDHSKLERFAIVDPMHPERGADEFFYPRPGKDNATVRLGIVRATGGPTVWVKWDAGKYPYLATVRWEENAPLTILVQNRAQTEQVLYAVDPKTGATKELLVERDDAWLNLDQSFPHWLEDGSAFFWRTERNGGPEIELRGRDGALLSSWVKPEHGFHALAGFDEKSRTLYFMGSPDPTVTHVYRVKEGGSPERVKLGATGPAVEWASLSKDASLLVSQWTTLSQMPRTAVFRADGTRLGELPSVAVEPALSVQVEIRPVGEQKLFAAIVRPKGFKKGQKLPVIVDVYGGPGHQVVRHELRPKLISQWLADRGHLVVSFDGRGTPGRGRAFERAIKNDFGTIPLADQVAALQALAKEMPELDLKRVGIYGWSFGGYMAALAVLKRPDVFKAAVSGAPVVDWTDYDTHYTERYLGTPQDNPKGYQSSSLLAYADKLERPLLLIHGTADDNVYFFHTLKLSDALFRAGKPHTVLPLSNFTHMVPEPTATQRLYERIARFFEETL